MSSVEKMILNSFQFYPNSFSHLFSNRRHEHNEDEENNDAEDYERSDFGSNVSTILLRFRNKEWELSYMKEPDFMLKYSVLMCFLVFIGIIVIQSLNSPYVISISVFFLLSSQDSLSIQQRRPHVLADEWTCVFCVALYSSIDLVQESLDTHEPNQRRRTVSH